MQPAFLTPFPGCGAWCGAHGTWTRLDGSRRRVGRTGRSRRVWAACLPPPDEEHRREEAGADPRTGGEPLKEMEPLTDEERIDVAATAALREIDQLAEEWIGSDLGRWEWYERIKGRRERILRAGRENEEKFDEELQELKRTFMEIDALFGTRMIDENSQVSAAGWSTVALIMLLYVAVGYWVFELFVGLFTSVSPSFPY